MARVRHGHGMASVNQTQPHCVNQMGNTHSKPLAAQHAMCESALKCFSDEGIKIPQKVNKYLPVNVAKHPIRPDSLATLLREPQISNCSLFVAFSTSLLR
jgi:hypothetical protein